MALLLLVFGQGCFKPHVASGGLECAAQGKPCPDGFECGAGMLCFAIGAAPPGSGGGGGSGGAIGSGGAPGTGGVPGTGGGGNIPPRLVGETCLITNEGQTSQSDNCDTGLLCMNDCAISRCYKVCASDVDCPRSSCTRAAPSGTPRLCELPYVTCDATGNAAVGGCETGLDCYLLSAAPAPSGGTRTVCDCSVATLGTGQPCSDTRACFPGLVCPPAASGLGAGYCRRVCDPATGCDSGGTCRPFGATWGYCF